MRKTLPKRDDTPHPCAISQGVSSSNMAPSSNQPRSAQTLRYEASNHRSRDANTWVNLGFLSKVKRESRVWRLRERKRGEGWERDFLGKEVKVERERDFFSSSSWWIYIELREQGIPFVTLLFTIFYDLILKMRSICWEKHINAYEVIVSTF